MEKRQAARSEAARLPLASAEDTSGSGEDQPVLDPDKSKAGAAEASGPKKADDVKSIETDTSLTDGALKDTHTNPSEEGKQKARGSLKATLLPETFKPTPYSVIIGRGKESKDHAVGNRRLRVLVSQFIPQYASAINRPSKSKIVSTVVSMVRDAASEEGGAFVKLGKDGRWYEVDESVAREKVGYTFREMLGDRYRSSSHSKVARKHQLRGEELSPEQEQPRTFDSPSTQLPQFFPSHLTMLETLQQQRPPELSLPQVLPQNVFSQHWQQQDALRPREFPPGATMQVQLDMLASAARITLPLERPGESNLSRQEPQWNTTATLPSHEHNDNDEEVTEDAGQRNRPTSM